MIETVARALCRHSGEDPDRPFVDRAGKTHPHPWWESRADEARAAIEAMRDIDVAMAGAAQLAMHTDDLQPTLAEVQAGWRAACDAALTPTTSA